ncbi:hypothetical protein BFP72_03695 [Reichenbachiella sp. 5M10]|nr:hypothetical protein BFP72_03240 [Reichenbachiella sp. 5M10]PIB34574.1 hypothetical protein BFP72_03695 [Reichenbachiella sp. 5M10]
MAKDRRSTRMEEEKLSEHQLKRLVIKEREKSRKTELIAVTILAIVALIATIIWGIFRTQ